MAVSRINGEEVCRMLEKYVCQDEGVEPWCEWRPQGSGEWGECPDDMEPDAARTGAKDPDPESCPPDG